MSEWIKWVAVPAVVAAAPAYGTQYLTLEGAQQLLFPAGTQYAGAPLHLTAEQVKEIERIGGVRVRIADPRVWAASVNGKPAGWLVVDEVYGKHEFITYAAAINADGSVRGIEVMDYRETYGHEIRNPNWRRQFAGKTFADPIRLDDDIKNISGATLSCRHVADGVKRLLAMYEVTLK